MTESVNTSSSLLQANMSNLDLQGTCELLLKMETELDVNSALYENTALWPLVRQYLWVSYIQLKDKEVLKPIDARKLILDNSLFLRKIQHFVKSRVGKLQSLRDKTHIRNSFSKRNNIDFFFLSQAIYYTERLNGKP